MAAVFARWVAGVVVLLMMRLAWAQECAQMDKPIPAATLRIVSWGKLRKAAPRSATTQRGAALCRS
jgi:hypothetical protein